jgi:hypothetical protein
LRFGAADVVDLDMVTGSSSAYSTRLEVYASLAFRLVEGLCAKNVRLGFTVNGGQENLFNWGVATANNLPFLQEVPGTGTLPIINVF